LRLPLQPKGTSGSVRCFSDPGIPDECDAKETETARGDGAEAEGKEGKGSSEDADADVVSKSRGSAPKSSADRRRSLLSRSHSSGHGSQGRIPDLLTVPGIGPRNLEKLMAKGIGKISELKQLYVDKVCPLQHLPLSHVYAMIVLRLSGSKWCSESHPLLFCLLAR
jgi:predicted flap endonuclease-1-like 5' DNA nuclease